MKQTPIHAALTGFRLSFFPGRLGGMILLLAIAIVINGVAFAQTEIEYETDYEGEISERDPQIVKAMKVSMYEYVIDDEAIDVVADWIKNGAENNEIFADEILPMMKEDCTKCHSATSTMSKAMPALPLTRYEEIKPFTRVAPSVAQCLECHADPAIQTHSVTDIHALFVEKSIQEESVHKDLLCVNCHLDYHKEGDTGCQDVAQFKNFVQLNQQDTDFSCSQLKAVECANCHQENKDLVQQSIHFTAQVDNPDTLPKCFDCHESHNVKKPELIQAKLAISENCGSCHEGQMETYLKTYHGKTTLLGSNKTAKCFDCHSGHDILPASNPVSKIHKDHLQETCSQCHENVNANFVGFIPHADYTDSSGNKPLFIAYLAMTGLLIGTFVLFGLHTLLWLTRSIVERRKKNPAMSSKPLKDTYVKRFRLSHTVLHFLIIVSFITLALSGMALKFPENPFFAAVSHLLGGPHNMGLIHRIGAVITFIYVVIHLGQLAWMFFKRKITFRGLLKEEYTLIPLPRDLKEIVANLRYFVGKAPRPRLGRWTYWEKFDYLAVFWGITIIGSTGLMLWFPQKVTLLLPGWILNIATIIHSDEALLAVGFIFTFHFFHNHLRPENFPMEYSIFTQKVSLERFKEERSREYEDLKTSGELQRYLVDPPAKWYSKTVFILGMLFLALGLIIIGAILYSLLLGTA